MRNVIAAVVLVAMFFAVGAAILSLGGCDMTRVHMPKEIAHVAVPASPLELEPT